MAWVIIDKDKRKTFGGKFAQVIKGKITKITNSSPKPLVNKALKKCEKSSNFSSCMEKELE